ncbi:hypothetical protein JR316_0011841 [Psilocybe cubensis]|uniref:Uncharacterized protein n=2 Tax=Psilocybe cubensis TaxID=181762 RepID=A0ACB8GML7_PSICU|nr:hypothetical protein JR316_0011841 [Psilocybe cubensis]KAH9476270.1 hypothetical protein JR316_0011841 [Psilocybe cubensis]
MFGATMRSLCILAFAAHTAFAGVVTVYLVDPPRPTTTEPDISVVTYLGTTHVSAVGTGEGGRTKYEMDAVQSLLVADIRGSTVTVLSEPTTNKFHFEENQTEMKLHQIVTEYDPPVTALSQNCKLDIEKQSGECVQKHIYRFEYRTDSAGSTTQTRTYESTSTFTGTLFPIATLTTSGAKQAISGNIGIVATMLFATAFARYL